MKDRLSYFMSFIGKRVIFNIGWFDYEEGVIDSVNLVGDANNIDVRFNLSYVRRYNKHYENGQTPVKYSNPGIELSLNDYKNFKRYRWCMWALADSKCGKDLVARIERTWDRKPKPEYNPYCDPNLLEKKQAKYYNLVKHHRNVDYLPIWVRTKYREDSKQYRLEKVEPKDYELWIVRNKAFVIFKNVAYAHKVKVTNLDRKFFFTEEAGVKSLE